MNTFQFNASLYRYTCCDGRCSLAGDGPLWPSVKRPHGITPQAQASRCGALKSAIAASCSLPGRARARVTRLRKHRHNREYCHHHCSAPVQAVSRQSLFSPLLDRGIITSHSLAEYTTEELPYPSFAASVLPVIRGVSSWSQRRCRGRIANNNLYTQAPELPAYSARLEA